MEIFVSASSLSPSRWSECFGVSVTSKTYAAYYLPSARSANLARCIEHAISMNAITLNPLRLRGIQT